MKELKAVVTGDIKNSSVKFKNNQKQMLTLLRDCYCKIRDFFPEQLPYEIDVFRGDGFQFLISDYKQSLKILLSFFAYAKGQNLDLKLGLGIGEVDYLNKTSISESSGEAFILSGRGLESLGKKSQVSIQIPETINNLFIPAYTELLDIYLLGLSNKNALAVFGKLMGLTQDQTAKLWATEVSRQSISKHWQVVNVDKFIESTNGFSVFLCNTIKKAML